MTILKETGGLSNEDIRKLKSLRPGTPLDIQLTSPTATKRARTELVGIDGTRSIIMQYPDENKWGSVREHIYVDSSVIVRAILEGESGEVIAFKVKVAMLLSKPGNLIFTTFPLALQSQELRAEKRAIVNIPVDVLTDDNSILIAKGSIKDISSCGCRIQISKQSLKAKLVSKQNIILRVASNAPNIFEVTGTVMNAKSDGDAVYYGMKFLRCEQSVEALLNAFMVRA